MASIKESGFTSPSAQAQNNAFSFGEQGFASQVLDKISTLNGWQMILILILTLIAYDQISYIWQKGSIVGPSMKIPFMGPFFEAVWPDFDKYLAKWASGDLSCVSVFHKFVVIASSRDTARKIFFAPTYAKPCVVDIAQKLLRPQSWVFLDGKAHVEYRKGLNGLFTRQALATYLPGQEEIFDKYFQVFLDQTEIKNKGQPSQYMHIFRELMCAVSLRTFVGHYMPESSVKKIADDYYRITAALDLVNFPIIIPFTRTWYGKRAADVVVDEFSKCAAMSKVKMATGAEATCILDFWVRQMQDSEKYREKIAQGIEVSPDEKPTPLLRMFEDFEISLTLLTFLFASQDATSSACTWMFQLMADQPQMLDRVRAENLAVRNGDRNVNLSLDLIDNLTYTRAVVKEVLRYRPPVIMVPYVAVRDFPISDTYTAPKGSMVIPSVWPATHDPEAYPNPDVYDPDRWITGDAEKQSKNWLVFGAGPHYCLGQTYAQNNLIALIGKASMFLDWKHKITPDSEVIKVFATLFPMDDLYLTFSRREAETS